MPRRCSALVALGVANSTSPALVDQDDAVAHARQSRTGDVVLAIGEGGVGDHRAQSFEDRQVGLLVERRRPAQRSLQAHHHRHDRGRRIEPARTTPARRRRCRRR